jgi:hypothetical protein
MEYAKEAEGRQPLFGVIHNAERLKKHRFDTYTVVGLEKIMRDGGLTLAAWDHPFTDQGAQWLIHFNGYKVDDCKELPPFFFAANPWMQSYIEREAGR